MVNASAHEAHEAMKAPIITAVHERWIGTLKSVIRANMMQSGFPASAWDFAMQFSAIALSIAKPAPIHAWEKDATGAILTEFQHKENQTCWEAHHDGAAFSGPRQLFGRLVHYWTRNGHPLMPTAAPGLFIVAFSTLPTMRPFVLKDSLGGM